MDLARTLPPTTGVATPNAPTPQLRPSDQEVPPVKAIDSPAIVPEDKVFIAQVVTARLSGTAFPENPSEIAPADRTLRPYDVPMLPFTKDESEIAAEEKQEESEKQAATQATDDSKIQPKNNADVNTALHRTQKFDVMQTNHAGVEQQSEQYHSNAS